MVRSKSGFDPRAVSVNVRGASRRTAMTPAGGSTTATAEELEDGNELAGAGEGGRGTGGAALGAALGLTSRTVEAPTNTGFSQEGTARLPIAQSQKGYGRTMVLFLTIFLHEGKTCTHEVAHDTNPGDRKHQPIPRRVS